MRRAISTVAGATKIRLFALLAVAALALAVGAWAQSVGPRFSHLTTGFALTGAHESAKCETCHVKGVFKGTPKICEACHRPGNNLSSAVMPSTHAPTTQRCDLCHTTVSFIGARWNHVDAQPGGCIACHNGSTAPGKPAGHVLTTQSCDTCHRTSAWLPAGFDHTGIASGCSSCHNGVAAKGKPATHIPTSQPCETCHTSTSSYAVWTMSHAQIVSACATCHGGQFPDVMAKPASHVPTSAPCESCHTGFSTFKGAAFDHAGITAGCSSCHNGSTALGMVAGHLPTNQPCEVCHSTTNFKSFAGATMNHAGIASGCSACHASGSSFFGVAMKTPPANHVPTSAPCETCHAASNFTSFAGTAMNHAGISSGCASCHAAGSSFFGVAMKTPPATHIPFGGATCEACHALSNFVSFAGTPMNHTPVAGITCATCHETGKSWFGVTIVTRPTPAQDPAHPTTGDCGACHSTSTFAGAGKPANHLPTNQPCTLCHSNPNDYSIGTMNHAGITSGCAACHATGSSFANIVPKTPPATHIPFAGAACEACHTASNFTSFAGTPMNHSPVAGISCATCHETGKNWFGVTIVTRPTPAQDPAHPTTGDCGTCHTTSTFAGAGKPANHVPTNQPCSLCHSNPGNYAIGTMNHLGITSGCATCHAPGSSFANIVPVTPPATHLPTSQPCETCHAASNFTTFAGTAMNHAGITSGCATCHATGKSFFGVTMKTPPATHIPFAGAACEACHAASNFTSFAGTPMNHTPVAAISCATCHETGKSWFGVTIVTRPTPAQDPAHPTTGDCGACHTTSTFAGATGKPANHLPTNQPCSLCHSNPNDYSIGTMNHAGITSGCATCHAPGSSFANIVPKAPPSNHVPTSASCETCHAASNFTTFAGTAMNHAGITSGCATCHATGKSFFGVTMKTPPATHIPFGGAACEACHAASNFTSFAGTPMNHSPVAGITCATCHETGKSWFGVTIMTRPTPAQDPNHPQTGDCGTCHSTTSFDTGVSKPANHLPTNQACSLCHTNPNDYSVATMNHAGITSGCATCHAAGSSFANVVPKAPPANHVPTSKACETCHSATNFTSFAGTAMNHTGITTGCATCHATGKSFFGVTMKTPPANHIPFAGAVCEACHAPTNYTSFAGTPMNHNAVTGMKCVSCHELGMSWYGVNIVTRPSASHNPGQDCGACHNTRSFDDGGGGGDASAKLRARSLQTRTTGATAAVGAQTRGAASRTVHLGIAPGSCLTCHNGTSAPAKPAQHLMTALSCDSCHRTTAWRPATFTHVGAAPGGCSSCHNAVQAKGKAAAHFATVRSCDTCHRTTSWAAPQYRHVSPAYRQHSASVGCMACHQANSEAVVWRAPALKPDCAACHADRFLPQQHPKPGGGLHTLVELRDCAGSCHLGAQARAPKSFAARHRPTDGSF